jgi:2-polyprenyl-3-methyl-5-hydroxy-6-metoxy-1,4-benzoquinol methylase
VIVGLYLFLYHVGVEQVVYDWMREHQFSSWWYNGRRAVIQTWLFQNVQVADQEILDIGSGYGNLIPVLKKHGVVDALEPHAGAHVELKNQGARLVHAISNFPTHYPAQKYQVVTLFDVLEHFEDDRLVLDTIYSKLLVAHGKLIITVPAYQWLWTHFDEVTGHYRRYTLRQLKQCLEQAGFTEIKVSYFMTLLLPFGILDRLLMKITQKDDTAIKPIHPVLNFIFQNIFMLESKLLRWIKFPFGMSLIAVASKPNP